MNIFFLQVLVDTTKAVTPTYSMIEDILGTQTYQGFITQLFFAVIGVAISLLMHGANRDVAEPTTPMEFSLLFLIKDNWKRILLNLLLIFVTIRFFKEITGFELSLFFCLLVGLAFDKLAQWLKDKATFLEVNRTNPVSQ